jgi:hypothetical protein
MSLIGCTGFEFALQDQIHKRSQSERTSTPIEATPGGLPEPGRVLRLLHNVGPFWMTPDQISLQVPQTNAPSPFAML